MPGPQPLILLPPSEGKSSGGTGPVWAPGTMADAALDGARRSVLKAARGAGVVTRGAPTSPASTRYTGVLYQELDWSSLPSAARRRGVQQVRTVSGLWGLVAANDPIPAYRLKMSASLAPMGRLSTWWRPRLAPVLAGLAAGRAVWDLLPNEHEAAMDWPSVAPGRLVTVRFLDRRRTYGQPLEQAPQGQPGAWLLIEQPTGPGGAGVVPAPARLPARPARLARSATSGPRSCSAPPRRLASVSARPHFSIARIPVRIEPVFFVIAGLWGLRYIDFGIDVVGCLDRGQLRLDPRPRARPRARPQGRSATRRPSSSTASAG